MPAYFTSLSSTCPTVDSPESTRFTGSREALYLLLPEKSDIIDWVDCSWRPESGVPPWLLVNIRIHLDSSTPHDSAYEYAERDFTRSRDEALTRAGKFPPGVVGVAERTPPTGPAIMVADADADQLRQTTRVGNLLVTVKLLGVSEDGSRKADEMMAELTAAADAITAEALEHMAKHQTATA